MRLAYADPPYPGQAKKHYGEDAREVNHELLIRHLCDDFDGWALSTSEPALRDVLNLCPVDVRVGPWVKPFASFKPNVNPAYTWGPVIFWGGRKRTREQPTVRDWVAANITLQKGTHGAKPPAFSYWIIEMLGAEPGDDFHDLFPGSGAVTEAWETWCRQKTGKQETLELTA